MGAGRDAAVAERDARERKATRLLSALCQSLAVIEGRPVTHLNGEDDALMILDAALALTPAQWDTLAQLGRVRPPSTTTIALTITKAERGLDYIRLHPPTTEPVDPFDGL